MGLGIMCIMVAVVVYCIAELRMSVQRESSNVQNLLTEIRDKLGNSGGDGEK
jgi:hypothetical protein